MHVAPMRRFVMHVAGRVRVAVLADGNARELLRPARPPALCAVEGTPGCLLLTLLIDLSPML